mgnify:CR=1 FL=1
MRKQGLAGLFLLGAVVVIGSTFSTTNEAQARDDWFFGFNNHGDFSFGFRHTDRGYRHYKPRRHFKRPRHRSRHVYRRPAYGYGPVVVPGPRFVTNYGACHKVWKRGHWRGRRAHVGGLMCYDRHGYAHIRPGSQYFIRYY